MDVPCFSWNLNWFFQSEKPNPLVKEESFSDYANSKTGIKTDGLCKISTSVLNSLGLFGTKPTRFANWELILDIFELLVRTIWNWHSQTSLRVYEYIIPKKKEFENQYQMKIWTSYI